MIHIINSILGRSDSDKGGEQDDYPVCTRHGHDHREYESDGIKSEFTPINPMMPITFGIKIDVIPGRLLGLQSLMMKETAPCRDCPHEKSRCRTIEKRVVYREDGEVKTVSWRTYEDMEDRHQG